jgi:bifunctional DNase/RNase
MTADHRTAVTIAGVRACDCPSHALVIMRETDGKRRFRLRVHSDAGQAILAELADIASPRAALIDMMRDALSASGSEIDGVIVSPAEDTLTARLALTSADGDRMVDVEPCEALIAACRLRIPVFVDERAETAVPAAFRKALGDLDLGDLGS